MLSPDQRNAIAALHAKHPHHFMRKFFTTREMWCQDAQRRAERLGLADTAPKRILDIGCGVPYFMLAAESLGHVVTGVDVPDAVLAEACQIMGTSYCPHVITVDETLPRQLPTRVDLVTMFGVNLKRRDGEWWAWGDWVAFIRSVLIRFVNSEAATRPRMRIVMQPNTGPFCSELLFDVPRWQEEFAGLAVSVEVTDGWLIFST